MRNFFALVGLAIVAFAGLGWYLDWYHLSRQPATTGTQRFQVDVNPNKIADDVKKGIEQGSEIVEKLRDEKAQNSSPAPAPAEKTEKPAVSDAPSLNQILSPAAATKSPASPE